VRFESVKHTPPIAGQQVPSPKPLLLDGAHRIGKLIRPLR
jgi:hypothetical protein